MEVEEFLYLKMLL